MAVSIVILGPQFSTFVRSVQLLCEEKGVEYTVSTEYQGHRLVIGDEVHRSLHPFVKVPVVLINDEPFYETASVLRYLDAILPTPTFQPLELSARAKVDQWCSVVGSYIDKALVRNVLLEFAFPKGEGGEVRMDIVKAHLPYLNYALSVLKQQLIGKDYLCGNQVSLADFVAAPMLCYLCDTPLKAQCLPEGSLLMDYVERLQTREAVQRVCVKL
ncbi:MAG: glutathione S-transferase family protein [Pontibacterium sp.]